jgi:hypothetical protein
MLGYLLRARGAVQPHHGHVERVDHGCGGGAVGADQQRADRLHRHLHKHRQIVLAGAAARDLGAVHRGLDLQRVLAGLDEDRIGPAGDQRLGLHGQHRFQRVVGVMQHHGKRDEIEARRA